MATVDGPPSRTHLFLAAKQSAEQHRDGRAIGVAQVAYLPERPLLTRAGECRAGCWS